MDKEDLLNILKNNPIGVLVFLSATILLSTLIINAFIEKSIEPPAPISQPVAAVPAGEGSTTAVSSTVIRQTIVPEQHPEKYGIIIHDAAQAPRTEAQWDHFMEEAIIKNKVLEQPGASTAVEAMKKSPEDFATREKEVDDRIALFEKKKRDNPSDSDAEHRLQTLYMLKSLGKILKNKVTEPPVASEKLKLEELQLPH